MRVLFLAMGLVLVIAGCKQARSPCVFEIPEGFTGWVLIEFGLTNCPPLLKRDGKLVFPIGRDGHFCTRSAPEFGWAKDAHFSVGKSHTEIHSTGWGGGGLIWGGSNGNVQETGRADKTYMNFFVGTEGQFTNANQRPRPK
jgi:hypothetical protein